MTSSFRNGLVAFAMAATAVIALSLVVLFATNNGDGTTAVGEPVSMTPAVLGESQTPVPTPTPTPTP